MLHAPRPRRTAPLSRALRAAAVIGILAACGNDGTNPDPNPPPTSMAVASGNNQSATAGAALPQPLVVRVADAANQGLPDIDVVWEVLTGGGTLAALITTTDADGLARVQYLLGPNAGTNRVRATVQNSTLTTTFEATATAPPPGGTP
jgi:Bacterial Ig-like domain (group 1)